MSKGARLKRMAQQKPKQSPVLGSLSAWAPKDVRARHLDLAQQLVHLGVEFRHAREDEKETVRSLVRSHIKGSEQTTFAEESGFLVALDTSQQIIGCTVVGLGVDDHKVLMMKLTSLVVVPEWRGKGLGTVLVGMLHQVIQNLPGVDLTTSPLIIYGSCSVEGKVFYRRAGFDVLEPGQPLMVPFGNMGIMHNQNVEYPCWFSKIV